VASVLLRKIAESIVDAATETTFWEALSAQSRADIQGQLLSAIELEPETHLRKRLCDTVATVATIIFSSENAATAWPELWTHMYSWVKDGSYTHQVSSLLLFELLGEYIAVEMFESFPVFADIFAEKLREDAAPLVNRVAAAKAAVGVIVNIEPKHSHMDLFVHLLPDIIRVFVQAVESDDHESSEVLIPF
jgi:hypothetical protein